MRRGSKSTARIEKREKYLLLRVLEYRVCVVSVVRPSDIARDDGD